MILFPLMITWMWFEAAMAVQSLSNNTLRNLPVVATLEDLDEASLKKILTDSKNALVKQYQRLFEMENIELTFADEALGAVACKAIERKTGHAACSRSSRPSCWRPCSTSRASTASRKS